ncbi:hypothetical protein WKR88_24895 [Trinickia caryophylli]|uniref:3-oxoacyl-[acyl-carrier-protein] synthase III n=1 Tax=Trinickia caryophylli TaxID=28094 RepID=A0A1X7G6U0_TRICW|nr:hypothetical protein [Trinickia caryophylli]TRX14304.1 hypothetical protein FNF07_23720 [Trinickia caryophylli]WQE14133.1 hypothetical protein U0034_25910 [Trinickia caryophylli]GLU33368.1 hypothetical protein Busp01_32100 [Trinickia caryophylli]SMF64196.1 3-oxoacyl-[acyl-carrier-protein] synthase III [Trinickia caryophylli]
MNLSVDQPAEATFSPFGIARLGSCFGDATMELDDLTHREICSVEEVDAIRAAGSRQFFRSMTLSIEELAVDATRNVLREAGIEPADVGFLVFCSTVFESTALYPDVIASRIADGAGCVHAKTFSVQHAYCVSPFVALQILKEYFGEREQPAYGVVVCADMIGKSAEYLRPIGVLGVHSDGAAAMLVTNRSPEFQLLDTEIFIDPARFQGRSDDGRIQHDVRYFMLLAKVLKTLLNRCNVDSMDDVALFPNNLSAPSWRKIGQLLSIREENILLGEMPRVAHVFGADPFLNLASPACATDRRYALLVASGIAGAFGAALMRRCL